MRSLLWLLAMGAVCVAAFYGIVILASESGEVVTLRTGSGSEARSTRLWIVDQDGAEWVRTGHPGKGWFVQVRADPRVELERSGQASPRVAVPVEEAAVSERVNRAFSEKYAAADWIVALSGDASRRIVVRLDPPSLSEGASDGR